MIMENITLLSAFIIPAVIAYLLGSINSAIIITKLIYKKDIREFGSNNAGMTNVLRTFGKKPAAVTLIFDFGKGILAVILGRIIFSCFINAESLFAVSYICAILAIIGHIFPIYYGFRGGKGVLTTAGMMIILDPLVFLGVAIVFLIVVIFSRYISLSSVIASVFYPILTALRLVFFDDQYYEIQTIFINITLAAIIAVLIIFMHRSNIGRLIRGEESKLGQKIND